MVFKRANKTADQAWAIIDKQWRMAQEYGGRSVFPERLSDDLCEDDYQFCKRYFYEHY